MKSKRYGRNENAGLSDRCVQNKNFNSFDFAKFICSVLVVMIHVAPFETHEGTDIFSQINYILQNGICRVAVPLFFIFSGFFLYRKTPLESFSIEPTKKYLKHILFVYIIWSVIYAPLSLLAILKNPNGIVYGVFDYIRDVFFLASYNHLWYLTALMFAVAIISFLLMKKLSPRNE